MVLPLGAVRQWRRPAVAARRLRRLGVCGAVNVGVRGGTVPWRQGIAKVGLEVRECIAARRQG